MRGDEGLGARIARLEQAEKANAAHRADRDREIRDIKTLVNGIDAKVDKLIAAEDRREGAIGLGKWIVGTGFFGAVGTGLLFLIEWLRGHS